MFINDCRRNCAHNLRVMLWSWWSAINLSTRQTLIYAHSSRNQSWPTFRHPTFRHSTFRLSTFILPTFRHPAFNIETIRLSQIQTIRLSPLNQSLGTAEYYLCTLIWPHNHSCPESEKGTFGHRLQVHQPRFAWITSRMNNI